MQGTRVHSQVWEDPTSCGAAKPVYHNYRSCALEPTCHKYWANMPQLLKTMHLEPVLHNKEATAMRSTHAAAKSSPRSLQLEKAHVQQKRPNAAKNK